MDKLLNAIFFAAMYVLMTLSLSGAMESGNTHAFYSSLTCLATISGWLLQYYRGL